MAQGGGGQLPTSIRLNCPDIAYNIWLKWRALDRRFLPSQIINEPHDLLDDMLTLDAAYDAIRKSLEQNDG